MSGLPRPLSQLSPMLGSTRTAWSRLLGVMGSHAPALRRCLAGLVAAAVLQGLALACVFPLLAAVFPAPDQGRALGWLAAMTVLAGIATVLRWRAQGFEYGGRLAQVTHALRLRLGEQLRRMPLERLRESRAGEMNALLLGNVDEQLNYIVAIANLILTATVAPLALALAVLAFDLRLGALLLAVFPLLWGLHRWRRPAFARDMRGLNDAHWRCHADLVEYTQGLTALRAACQEGGRVGMLHAGFERLRLIQTAAHRQGVRPSVVTASLVELGLLGVVVAATGWVVSGRLQPAAVAAVMVIVVRLSEPMATLVSYTMVLEMMEAALERIEALLAIPALPVQLPQAMPDQFDVRFEQVCFHYADDPNSAALMHFSATLPAQAMTALVGPSGSGKTTVARLLLRHADPQAGSITIGGIDIRRMSPEVLNALVSVVFQDVHLFDDTVLANIRMGRPDADDAQVRAAAAAAQCLDFIERLPQGWNTRLGEIGDRLSGGERQRISIARALLKDAPIVVLDEPTAALDTESELAVQRAIDTLVRDKTVIVIAHRLSTIAGADRILVVEDGRLVEQGRHEELLTCNGRYGALWNAQQVATAWRVS
ncbi:ABC transporter ATP-binding protein [Xanthomonas hortorum]|uniref:ABC transporter ATP-binding protein n=1 Tax=Xanthomonas hortorum pv. pelargonii TaxID=453602 RepID=A0A6V7D9S5_9XANT|nr:ABC transporter ATP-binding protein [Xanthomonas hortorum]MCE4354743.1 ABC transporter ATP-binding protein/permease [Xanthomonas hortorum pv. pelargonii]MCM5522889.1 ABC transporter ATP-binding protein/permease [Xanthomonas hortorum pv. pelargonii]MCM5535061.1 ABC transporter ATP-binding protein/permease [Xanthomonas hortorum pv. pelargonii]MCM5539036.1 ABC transporter ATP-binding protein/permease [Xanthomonas hortorum pv. pelargonii]MCM5543469.1 ABC transporter ATP-binding protein/permease